MKHKTRQVVTSKEANYKFHILWDYILTSEDARPDPFGSGNFFGSSLQSFMQSSLKCRRQQGILQAENAVGMSCDVFCMSVK